MRKQTDEPVGAWVALFAILLGLTVLLAWASGAFAAEPLRKGKIAAPPAQQTYAPPAYQVGAPEPQAYKAHNWYVGGVGAYTFGVREGEAEGELVIRGDNTFGGGLVAGYLFRPNDRLGVGVEVDYIVRDLGDFAIDDATASVRGRLGVFVAPGTFVYATGGVAQNVSDQAPAGLKKGLVVGGGLEVDATQHIAVRAEVLHYTHGQDLYEWGDESSTQGRLGLLFKF